MKWFLIISYAFIGFLFVLPLSAQTSPCQDPAYRAFDFWIGNWQVGNDTAVAGYSRVEVILDSCVLLENWTGAGPSRGKSFNHFDFATGKWKQKWVDNFGSNIEFSGVVRNDSMVYRATTLNPQTRDRIFNQMIISKIDDDHVRQYWTQSADSSSWTVAFDAIYTRVESVQRMQQERDLARKVIDEMYSAITFHLDKELVRDEFMDCFIPEAHLINTARGNKPQSPAAFYSQFEKNVVSMQSFFERDGPSEIEIFGNVARYKGYYVAARDAEGGDVTSQGRQPHSIDKDPGRRLENRLLSLG